MSEITFDAWRFAYRVTFEPVACNPVVLPHLALVATSTGGWAFICFSSVPSSSATNLFILYEETAPGATSSLPRSFSLKVRRQIPAPLSAAVEPRAIWCLNPPQVLLGSEASFYDDPSLAAPLPC